MAKQNLPPDIVDKIQVYDALSDQSTVTGFDDGNRVKTIDIITKKNTQHGYFGKAVAGVGNKGLYDEAANINRFNDDQQISFIGQANNTNKQNFTVQGILGANRNGTGGRGGGFSGGNFADPKGMQSSHSNRLILNYLLQKSKLNLSFESGLQFGDLYKHQCNEKLHAYPTLY